YRYTERLSWPVFRQSRSGVVSQFGEVGGLTGLASPRRLEVAPYVVTKNVSVPTAGGFGRNQDVTAGANIKYGITSNLTLAGRLPSGLSVGVLEALTQRAVGRADTTIEPRTNYTVVRLQRDLRGGQSGVGLLFTGVDRALDAATAPLLRREAYVGALDARHRF